MRKLIYVAGPYTKGDVAMNVRAACEAADRLANAGLVAFVPHLSHFWHFAFPRPYTSWLAIDLAFLPFCSAVLRLPGDSGGADAEVKEAELAGIPVFLDIEALIASFPSQPAI